MTMRVAQAMRTAKVWCARWYGVAREFRIGPLGRKIADACCSGQRGILAEKGGGEMPPLFDSRLAAERPPRYIPDALKDWSTVFVSFGATVTF